MPAASAATHRSTRSRADRPGVVGLMAISMAVEATGAPVSSLPMRTPLRSATLGLAAGFVGGLLGVGGGIIYVPGMVLLLGLDQRRAHATSVAVIVASGTAAAISFSAAGNVDWSATPFILMGAVVGAPLGARLLGRLSERALVSAFAVVLVVAAVRMAF